MLPPERVAIRIGRSRPDVEAVDQSLGVGADGGVVEDAAAGERGKVLQHEVLLHAELGNDAAPSVLREPPEPGFQPLGDRERRVTSCPATSTRPELAARVPWRTPVSSVWPLPLIRRRRRSRRRHLQADPVELPGSHGPSTSPSSRRTRGRRAGGRGRRLCRRESHGGLRLLVGRPSGRAHHQRAASSPLPTSEVTRSPTSPPRRRTTTRSEISATSLQLVGDEQDPEPDAPQPVHRPEEGPYVPAGSAQRSARPGSAPGSRGKRALTISTRWRSPMERVDNQPLRLEVHPDALHRLLDPGPVLAHVHPTKPTPGEGGRLPHGHRLDERELLGDHPDPRRPSRRVATRASTAVRRPGHSRASGRTRP